MCGPIGCDYSRSALPIDNPKCEGTSMSTGKLTQSELFGQAEPDPDAETIVDLYRQGVAVREIRRRVGRSLHVIDRAVIESGIPRRGCGGRIIPAREDFFESITTPEQAWALGAMGADGCVHSPQGREPRVSFRLKTADADAVETMARLWGGNLTVRRYELRNAAAREGVERVAVLTVSSRKMAADLFRHGITERKSLTLHPWEAPEHLRPHYFRGLVECDGGISCNRRRGLWAIYLAGTLAVVEAFAAWVRAATGSRSKTYPQGKIWCVSFGGTNMPRHVASMLYADATVYLARKRSLAEELMALPDRRTFKLDHDKAATIRAAHARGEAQCVLAREHKCSPDLIWCVVHGKLWNPNPNGEPPCNPPTSS
jgi:hypothetical protein